MPAPFISQLCGFLYLKVTYCVSVMMTLTEEDYEVQYWPKLKTAIDHLLNIKPGAYIPISYEQMYRLVIIYLT